MRIRKSVVTVEPEAEPITVDEAKEHCKIDSSYTGDDLLLQVMIKAVRKLVEETLGRSLITQTRVVKFDTFPCFNDAIELDYGKLISVDDASPVIVKYYAADSDTLTVLSASDYWVDDHSDIPRIVIKNSWPSTYDTNRPNSVVVTYTAGYGATSTSIPSPIVVAVQEIVAALYEHRGDEKGFVIPDLAMTLLGPYIITTNAWY